MLCCLHLEEAKIDSFCSTLSTSSGSMRSKLWQRFQVSATLIRQVSAETRPSRPSERGTLSIAPATAGIGDNPALTPGTMSRRLAGPSQGYHTCRTVQHSYKASHLHVFDAAQHAGRRVVLNGNTLVDLNQLLVVAGEPPSLKQSHSLCDAAINAIVWFTDPSRDARCPREAMMSTPVTNTTPAAGGPLAPAPPSAASPPPPPGGRPPPARTLAAGALPTIASCALVPAVVAEALAPLWAAGGGGWAIPAAETADDGGRGGAGKAEGDASVACGDALSAAQFWMLASCQRDAAYGFGCRTQMSSSDSKYYWSAGQTPTRWNARTPSLSPAYTRKSLHCFPSSPEAGQELYPSAFYRLYCGHLQRAHLQPHLRPGLLGCEAIDLAAGVGEGVQAPQRGLQGQVGPQGKFPLAWYGRRTAADAGGRGRHHLGSVGGGGLGMDPLAGRLGGSFLSW